MFNIDEIRDLLSALNSWEKDDEGELLGTLLGGMLVPKEEHEKYLEGRRIKSEEASQEKEARTERSILLKAKLISMKNEAEAREFGEAILKKGSAHE